MKKFALLVMIVAAFAVPAPAVAATNGYTNVPGAAQGGGGADGASSPAAEAVSSVSGDSSGSVLPFTGLELALMLAAGVALLGTGLVLRRSGAQR